MNIAYNLDCIRVKLVIFGMVFKVYENGIQVKLQSEGSLFYLDWFLKSMN